jgi:hypothetical protein
MAFWNILQPFVTYLCTYGYLVYILWSFGIFPVMVGMLLQEKFVIPDFLCACKIVVYIHNIIRCASTQGVIGPFCYAIGVYS